MPSQNIKIIFVEGEAIRAFTSEIIDLRLNVFREYPYLYDGCEMHEREYLESYIRSNNFILVAMDGPSVLGIATGTPLLEYYEDSVKEPFQKADYDLSSIFYFGEFLVKESFRGQGLGVRFLELGEKQAKDKGYTIASFCTVERPQNHPLKPFTYQSLEGFWNNRGYNKHPELQTSFSWKDINDIVETSKTLTFWTKRIV